MDKKLFELLLNIEKLSVDDLEKVGHWVEFTLKKRESQIESNKCPSFNDKMVKNSLRG